MKMKHTHNWQPMFAAPANPLDGLFGTWPAHGTKRVCECGAIGFQQGQRVRVFTNLPESYVADLRRWAVEWNARQADGARGEATWAKARATARKRRLLETLINHPNTGSGERAAARNALARLESR
jgi:hypothetical protein